MKAKMLVNESDVLLTVNLPHCGANVVVTVNLLDVK